MDFVDKVYDLKLLADKYGLLLHKLNSMEYVYTINDDLCKDKFFGYSFNDEGRPIRIWIPKEWRYDETGHFEVKEFFRHERGQAKNWYDALLNQTWFWKWKIDKLLNQTIKNCTKIRKKRKEEEIKLIAIKGAQEFVAGN